MGVSFIVLSSCFAVCCFPRIACVCYPALCGILFGAVFLWFGLYGGTLLLRGLLIVRSLWFLTDRSDNVRLLCAVNCYVFAGTSFVLFSRFRLSDSAFVCLVCG